MPLPSDTPTDENLATLFTRDEPLGPTAVDEQLQTWELEALTDRDVATFQLSLAKPPTFIVGRKGSGKTALLRSRLLEAGPHEVVELSTDGTLVRVSSALGQLAQLMSLTEEGSSRIWETLLWGPVALRVARAGVKSTDDRDAFSRIWSGTADLRETVAPDATDDEVVRR